MKREKRNTDFFGSVQNVNDNDNNIHTHNARNPISDTDTPSLVFDDSNALRIQGIRIEDSDVSYGTTDDGVPDMLMGTDITLRLFGTGIKENTKITFTHEMNLYGGACQFPSTDTFFIVKGSVERHSALTKITLPLGTTDFYICAKNEEFYNTSSIKVCSFSITYFFVFFFENNFP